MLDHRRGGTLLLSIMRAHKGFTIIELVIAVAILAILVATGAPSFRDWIQNTQIRNAAEAALNGLQVARSEAVRRNGFTQFILGPDTGWRVVAVNPPAGGGDGACVGIETLQARAHAEGSNNATVAVTPDGAGSVTFTPLGWVGVGASACGTTIRELDFDSHALPADRSRALRIAITAGGGIRLCDPQVAAGDPRAC